MSVKSLLGAAALVLASQAQAGFVDFTFNGANNATLGDNITNSYTESTGNNSVDIMPYMLTTNGWESLMGSNDNRLNDDMRVSRANNALGVNRQPGESDNNNQIDGFGSIRDGLWFDFGDANWSSLIITFLGLNTQDQFEIWMGDSWDPTSADSPLEYVTTGSSSGQTYTIENFGYRYLFITVADDGNTGTTCRNNNVNTVGTNASCVQIDNIRAIPEPASIALLGMGLVAGFGAKLRRLRKEKA